MVGGTVVWSATVSDSDSVDVTAIVGSDSNSNTGSNPGASTASVKLEGTTFPNAKLTLLKDGAVYTTLVASNDGHFNINVNGLAFGNYQFSLYAQDRNGIDSNPYTVTVPVFEAKAYAYTGIVLPPTIKASSLVVSLGQTYTVSGYASAGATILVEVPGVKLLATGTTDSNGFYSITITADLAAGVYQVRTRAQVAATQSLYSKPVQILYYKGIPGEPVPNPPSQLATCVDYNKDRRVNLIDFSILLFSFENNNPPASIDCNSDHRIDIKDFSILMYFWTG